MRKIIFSLMLAIIGSIAISSCTEDAIQPSHKGGDSPVGGGGETGKI